MKHTFDFDLKKTRDHFYDSENKKSYENNSAKANKWEKSNDFGLVACGIFNCHFIQDLSEFVSIFILHLEVKNFFRAMFDLLAVLNSFLCIGK